MVEQPEKRSEHLTFRETPTARRRIEAAADVAGVSRSHLLREAAAQVAREVLREAAEDDQGEQ